MIKTIRVMLLPNNKQNTKLFQYAGAARYAYNWVLSREKENVGYSVPYQGDMRKIRKEKVTVKQVTLQKGKEDF